MGKSSSLSFMQMFSRFLLMFQFFHPISTTGILPFLLLTILNFRIYRRYVDIVEFLWIARIMQWARNFFFLFQNAKKWNSVLSIIVQGIDISMKSMKEQSDWLLWNSIFSYNLFCRVTSYGFSVVHKKDVHLTRILISIVITFLFLNLPRLGIGLFEISR